MHSSVAEYAKLHHSTETSERPQTPPELVSAILSNIAIFSNRLLLIKSAILSRIPEYQGPDYQGLTVYTQQSHTIIPV